MTIMDVNQGAQGTTTEERREVLAAMLRARAARNERYPLTDAQFGLWMQQNVDPTSSAYNIPLAFCLHGRLRSPEPVRKALCAVIERHPALRTVFTLEDGTPYQQVQFPSGVEMGERDLEPTLVADWKSAVPALSRGQAGRAFDLSAGPLYRFDLVRVSAELHILLATFHHIVMDGWSIGVFLNDFAEAYIAHSREQALAYIPLPATYRDYATHRATSGATARTEADLSYWQHRLAGAPAELNLPILQRRQAGARFCGATHRLDIPSDTAMRLAELAREHGVTSFMLMLATFQVFLARICDQDDLVLGVSVSNREDKAWRNVIGLYSDVLPMRATVRSNTSFAQYLSEVRKQCLEDYEHATAAMTRIIERVRPDRRGDRNMLFQAGFDFQNTPWPALVGQYVTLLNGDTGASKLDLNLNLSKVGDALSATFEYNSELFDAASIAGIAECYRVLLDSIVVAPHLPIEQLAIVRRDPSVASITLPHPGPQVPYVDILERVRSHALAIPGKSAMEHGDLSVTWADLEASSSRIAAHLVATGMQVGERVGLLFERTPAYVIALLGCMKAGLTYVPLDPAMPPARMADIVTDAGITTLLVGRDVPLIQGLGDVRLIMVDAVVDDGFAAPAVDRRAEAGTAYMIYTSGTTGRPKGVMIGYSALAAFARLGTDVLGIRTDDRLLQFASVSFDTSMEEIIPALVQGSTLVYGVSHEGSVQAFLAMCEKARITVLNLPTAYWHALADVLDETGLKLPACIRQVVIGGEAASGASLSRWIRACGREVRLLNTYGPTETTVSVVGAELSSLSDVDRRLALPIGQPYPSILVHIIDRRGAPVPRGTYGEIVIGGPTVAQGYFGLPELTAAKFTRDPFGPPGARMYRTGDFGRFLADGSIEFAGRRDDQVKVSGFRVELAEIDVVLSRCAGVTRVTTLANGDVGERRLDAFAIVDAESGAGVDTIKAWAAAHLPTYMRPATVTLVEGFPLTVSGKLDRESLARLAVTSVADAPAKARPASAEEAILASIWANVLAIEEPGVHDNFFDLGGHSLLLVRMLSRVRSVFGVEVPLADAFESPTVAKLALSIIALRTGGSGEVTRPVVALPRPAESSECTFRQSLAQQGMWFLAQLDPLSTAYNNPSALQIEGVLDPDALQGALDTIVQRHEILRTVFSDGDDAPVQVVLPHLTVPLERFDVSAVPDDEREASIRRIVDADAARPFDLRRGPLLRAGLLRVDTTRAVLTFNWHHIITDAWTLGLFLGELTALYNALREGQAAHLPRPALQYADYAEWQRQGANDARLARARTYWQEKLAGAPRMVDLPIAGRGNGAGKLACRHPLKVGRSVVKGLVDLSRGHGATLFMTCLAAFKILLWRMAGQHDVVVGTPVSGRGREELESIFGYFINTLVLRTDLASASTFVEALDLVRTTCVDAYAHQGMPFEELVRERGHGEGGSTSLFNISFVLEQRASHADAFPGAKVTPMMRGRQDAKFGLTLALQETANGLEGEWEWPDGLFDDGFIAEMSTQYSRLLELVAEHPGLALANLDLLTPDTRDQLLSWSSGEEIDVPQLCAHEFLEQAADRYPGKAAIICNGVSLDFAGLDEAANRLAYVLRDEGIREGDVVGLCLDRGIDMVLAMLAIWKAGASYTPIDTGYPIARVMGMLSDCHACLVVTSEALGDSYGDTPALFLDSEEVVSRRAAAPSRRLTREETGVTPGHPCYVLFTSGSTGRPKGVVVEHASLANLHAGLLREFERAGARKPRSWAWNAPLVFDASLQALASWASGSTIHLLPEDMRREPGALLKYLADHVIDVIDITPLQLAILIDAADPVTEWPLIVVGGEPIDPVLWSRVARLRSRWTVPAVNVYGPTEATIDATAALIIGGSGACEMPHIGRPMANVQAMVVGPHGELQPPGVPGELWLSGPGVARGYAGHDALTSERFIACDIGGRAVRVYRTGDVARWNVAGVLEFIGRRDHQVKILGRRIETGEIEHQLLGAPNVHAAMVGTCDLPGRGREVVGYVVPSGTPVSGWTDELCAYLSLTLPEYMLPRHWVVLEALPQTANGKIDRARLPIPVVMVEASLPREGATEEELARIWSRLLGVDIDGIGAETGFLQLGGHSLMAMRLLNAVRDELGADVSLRTLFEAHDLRAMARAIDDSRGAMQPVEEVEW